ncbi:salicylate 1-monooxygenase [Lophiotrema nucula]|uniref:Salicylate 1-monooxygenase n=1 Tax=Lophiotrema nucula TaxID=690887 RepID=A0A6A5YL88_9PLEO|nr:salicylate 1-monooxygenase [Lophiotrema nucula]
MTQGPKLQIAVAGAGIAGLTTAIALKQHPNIDVQIYERASKLQEIGASIALGPNGLRTLERLGIDNALDDSIAFRNKSGRPMIYRHYKTNKVISIDSHQGEVEYRHQTSRFYRAHLQQALLEHVDPTHIHLEKAFHSVTQDQSTKKLHISFTDGTQAKADILLGSDGINSAVRRFFVPASGTKWTGSVAFRSVFPLSHVDHIKDLPDEANFFWGPDRPLFLSRLGKDTFTVAGFHQVDPNDPNAPYKDKTWNSDGDVNILREYYKDWSPLIRSIIDAIPYTRVYPNVAAEGLDTWVHGNGRVTFAGDAAHAHGGAFAAGGSLAIDDAWAFATSILHVFPPTATKLPSDDDVSKALRLYERTRKAHTDRVLFTVHSGNKSNIARVGKRESEEELLARMKNRHDPTWIHEHDVVATFQQALSEEPLYKPQARL